MVCAFDSLEICTTEQSSECEPLPVNLSFHLQSGTENQVTKPSSLGTTFQLIWWEQSKGLKQRREGKLKSVFYHHIICSSLFLVRWLHSSLGCPGVQEKEQSWKLAWQVHFKILQVLVIGAFSAQYKSQTCVDTFCSNSANHNKPVFVFAQGTNGW